MKITFSKLPRASRALTQSNTLIARGPQPINDLFPRFDRLLTGSVDLPTDTMFGTSLLDCRPHFCLAINGFRSSLPCESLVAHRHEDTVHPVGIPYTL